MRNPTTPRLSPRDLAILDTLQIHGQATAGQLQRLHFADGSPASRGVRMRRVMARLLGWGAVARLPKRWIGGYPGGSDGYIYQLPTSKSRALDLHRSDVTELYVRAVEAHRAGWFILTGFEAESRSYRQLGVIQLKPDGWLRIERDGRGRQVFIEVDRGSESSTDITAKLDTYTSAYHAWQDDYFPLVLFIVQHEIPVRQEAQYHLIARTIQRHPAHGLFAVCRFEAAISVLVA